MGGIVMLLIFTPIASVVWDVFTYEDRQSAWESRHPGATYIRGYRKLTTAEREVRS